MYTREEYLHATDDIEDPKERERAGREAHRRYYGQFVDETIKWMVRSSIGLNAIVFSEDEHFNDIPLRKWDALAGYRSYMPQPASKGEFDPPRHIVSRFADVMEIEAGAGRMREVPIAPADVICVLKEAARQMRDEARQHG